MNRFSWSVSILYILKTKIKNEKLQNGDLIAITKDNKLVGYTNIHSILDKTIMLDVSKKVAQSFNELHEEGIDLCFEIY